MPINSLRPQLVEVGRIRLGFKDPNKKQADRLEQFRFTSPAEHLIRELARLYGGEPRPWTPENGGAPQFEVFSEASDIPIYLPKQRIDPWLELWTGAKACIRRCDGEVESLRRVPCICDAENLPEDSRNRCKPTVRVNLMLAEMPGLQIWSLVSHGFNMCARLAALAPFVAEIPMPVPGRLLVIKRSRNVFDLGENKVVKRDLIMPEILIDGVTAKQWQIGGDALTQAIAAASGTAELGHAQRRMIAAGPAQPEMDDNTRSDWISQIEQADDMPSLRTLRDELDNLGVDDAEVMEALVDRRSYLKALREILLSIEQAKSVDQLVTIRNGMNDAGIPDLNDRIKNAWRNKKAAIEAAREVGGSAAAGLEPEPHLGDDVVVPVEPEQVEPDEVAFPELDEAPQYNVDTEYSLIFALIGPKWSTAQVNDMIKARCGVEKVSDATGDQLHQVRLMVEKGEI